jgi:hypothetical protein
MYLDRISEGLDLIDIAVQQSQRNPEVLYFQALGLLQVERDDDALNLLEEAVALEGYYRQFIALDPDLQSLKGRPQFIRLLPKKVN